MMRKLSYAVMLMAVLSLATVFASSATVEVLDTEAWPLALATVEQNEQTTLVSIHSYSNLYISLLSIVQLDPVSCQVIRNITVGKDPYAISVDVDVHGNIYVANQTAVYKLNGRGNISVFETGIANQTYQPWFVRVDRLHNVFAVYPNQRAIFKWNTNGTLVLRIAFNQTVSPRSVAIDDNNNIYVTINIRDRIAPMQIHKFDALGNFLGIFANRAGNYLAISHDGDVYTNIWEGPVLRYNSDGDLVDEINTPPFQNTTSLALDDSVPGGALYLGVVYSARIVKVTNFIANHMVVAA